MIGEIKDDTPARDVDNDVEDEVLDDNVVTDEVADVDNVGDISVEINVEELVAKIEATDDDDQVRKREIHKRLEDIEDRRKTDEDLGSTYNFNLDDEL